MAEQTPSAAPAAKLKVGMFWAASCGGCDISLLEIGPRLLDLIAIADVVFWPCAADFKYRDVAGYPDGHIDVCFYTGGIRNSEQEEVARLLRRKSKCLVAYGACSGEGGIPALANLKTVKGIYQASYHENPSIDNAKGVEPQPLSPSPCGELEIPRFYPQLLCLQDVVPVDYVLPGCPPQADRVWEAIQALAGGKAPLSNRAAKVGCTDKAVCDECKLEKKQVKIKEFKRIHQSVPEPNWCLLEQGFLCMGPATRSGCGARCSLAGMPCEGCYGPAGQVTDQGMAMVSAIASMLDAQTEERAQELIGQIADPSGSFYRFSLAASHLKARK